MVSIQAGSYLFLVLFTLLFLYWFFEIIAVRYDVYYTKFHTILVVIVVLLGWYLVIFEGVAT